MWCGAFSDTQVPRIREELGSLLSWVKQGGEPAVFETHSALMVSGGYFPSNFKSFVKMRDIREYHPHFYRCKILVASVTMDLFPWFPFHAFLLFSLTLY